MLNTIQIKLNMALGEELGENLEKSRGSRKGGGFHMPGATPLPALLSDT